MADPLAASAGSSRALTYIINVLFQLDCLIACLCTGARNKTISCWCGEAEEGRLGSVWYFVLAPVWLPVNWIARTWFGAANHCEESVGPFTVPEDAP